MGVFLFYGQDYADWFVLVIISLMLPLEAAVAV